MPTAVNQPRLGLFCAALALLGAARAAVPIDNGKIAEKPQWSSSSLFLDGRNNLLVLPQFSLITQNGYSIQADEARTTDANNFQNSRWTLTSKIKITTPDGRLTADKATVVFAQNQIRELHITGSPATFEHQDTDKQTPAKGSAGTIDYDLRQNTVRLSDNAWIYYRQNECRALVLLYNISEQVVSAKHQDQQGQRVNCVTSNSLLGPDKPAAAENALADPATQAQ